MSDHPDGGSNNGNSSNNNGGNNAQRRNRRPYYRNRNSSQDKGPRKGDISPHRNDAQRRPSNPPDGESEVTGGPIAQEIRRAGLDSGEPARKPSRPDGKPGGNKTASQPNRGPRRERNPMDRGPRRSEIQSTAPQPPSQASETKAPTQPQPRNGQKNRPQPQRRGRAGQAPASNQPNRGPKLPRTVISPAQSGSGRKPTRGRPRKPMVSGEEGAPQGNNGGQANPFTYHKPPPIKTSRGIKSLSQDGTYSLSWWAARWIGAMELLVDGRRLSRGKSYAKEGQVLTIEEKPGGVQAQVQGSRPKPYRVAIEVTPLSDREWEQVFDVLASQALFAAQLLAGEMPRNIEEAFQAAGTSLFPARLGDLRTDCTCPDWANPCKHVAATHYILAERFDEDPFLLFRLRGRTSEEILAALRLRRAGSASVEPVIEEPPQEEILPAPPLEANLSGFYNLSQTLDDFALSFKEPLIEMAVLKRLGDPNFLGQESLLATLEPVYRAVRQSALEAALGEAKEKEEENGNGETT